MVGPFVRFVERAAMKRTLGIGPSRRERIATERRDRGVNCRAVSRYPAADSTVHSGFLPFRHAQVQFSRDSIVDRVLSPETTPVDEVRTTPTGATGPTPSGAA